jgi:hypothetical protein
MPQGKKLKRLTQEEHADAARLLCGVVDALHEAINLIGPAVGAARMDIGIKAANLIDVRLVMHLQDAWDDDFGGEGNPYRAAVNARMAAFYAKRGIPDPFAAARS